MIYKVLKENRNESLNTEIVFEGTKQECKLFMIEKIKTEFTKNAFVQYDNSLVIENKISYEIKF
jgi:hypothetical protein